MQTTYRVDGMTCGGCVKSVAAKLSTVASDVEVTLTPPQARLSAAADLTVAKLNELMSGKYKFTALAADIDSVHRHAPLDSFPPSPSMGEGRGGGDRATDSRPEVTPTSRGKIDICEEQISSRVVLPHQGGGGEKTRETSDGLSGSLSADAPKSWFETYQPLLLIAGYIALASFAGTTAVGRAGFDWSVWMTNAMAGFFLVFSAFKFLNLKGFAEAYATYDLGAKAWAPWGYIYPFLELLLGCAYLFRWNLPLTNVATILLMGFSSLGVIQALSRKQTIRCACLGTVLNVPMSTITLVEDLAMVGMASLALLSGH
jgi:copper chaperone CopZ